MSQPLVSCLMVTRDRSSLARRALRCLAEQTWTRLELVIIDDGEEDYEPVLAPYRKRLTIHYHKLKNDRDIQLGGLRNISLDKASGDYCLQWDDDEWVHPERIERQLQALQNQDLDAIMLKKTLMHIDNERFVAHPYRTQLKNGTPGTLLHRQTGVRYPNLSRREDTLFAHSLRKAMRVGLMQERHSHLFIRCFHGGNTWDLQHFTERLHQGALNKVHYARARLRRDLLCHPAFRLNPEEVDSKMRFLSMSRELGLISP